MNIYEGLQQYRSLFIDTAPIIYFVEENPQFFSVVSAVFEAIDEGRLIAFTSPITLSESLIFPYQQDNEELANIFRHLITNGNNTRFINTNHEIGLLAAKLRVKYNLSLTDALQLATAIDSNCDGFLTNDLQLKRVTEISIVVVKEYLSEPRGLEST